MITRMNMIRLFYYYSVSMHLFFVRYCPFITYERHAAPFEVKCYERLDT